MTSGGKQGTSRGKRENPGNEVGSFYLLSLMYVCSYVVFKGFCPSSCSLHYAVRM